MRLFKLLLFFIVPSLILQPLHSYEKPSYQEIINLFQKKTALIQRITINGIPQFDLIISLLEDIQKDNIDEDIDIQELDEFLVLLLRFGFHGTQEEWESLERDNKVFFEENYGDEEDDFSFIYDYSGEIVLCGGFIKKGAKAVKKTGKAIRKGAKNTYSYIKEHKKEAIIIATTVVGVVVIGTVVLPALGGAVAATLDSSLNDNKKQDFNFSKREVISDSSYTNAAIMEGHEREIVHEYIETLKKEIKAEPSYNPDPSILDKSREVGSYIAHQVLDGVSELISPFSDALDSTKELISQFSQREENSIINQKSLKENFENLIARCHEVIDDAFSTDLSKHFTQEETGYENDWSIGIIPPLGAHAATLTQENKLLEAGMALDKGGFTRAGRALMKHGYREGSVFPKPFGNPAKINEYGQTILEEILNDPNKKAYRLPNGNLKVFSSSGRGVHFTKDNKFIGFIEEQYE